ncbi:tetratricopeptide repeat protein [Tunturiibacter gelidoferens]|uniref:Tetratricopeptide (TPR) repeat protein n=1 Tax=Tunturiibacter lichenicola TaxID=2051959 RepID=A0A7Y9NPY8_9BACT|nr:tetratricopeptide (TPR) repeat protein [Edaphobacter lichenicola]
MKKRLQVRSILRRSWLLPLILLCSIPGISQSSETSDAGGRVVLVLPFDNRSGQAALAWVGDSFPDTLNQRLTSAGFLTIAREDRQYALDHLGLPIDFRPSRATTIRIAQNLDADFVIVGSYNVANGRIAVQAQVLEVKNLKLSAPLQDSSELNRLFDVENAIAWKAARQIDPHFNVAQQTFLAASGGVQLSAFENYIRGTDAPTSQERIKRLQAAIAANPNYPAALLALGKAQYSEREYDQAAVTFAKIPQTDRRALEAGFYIGLSRFNTAKYAEAESAFAFVASRLPLPEVVNNQAVASSRQGHNAVPLFQRASTADPNDPDYHYNLAVALFRQGDFAGAKREVDLTLKLRPADSEAAQLKTSINSGRKPPAVAAAAATDTTASSDFDPLERIRRTYSEASFRQAAFQLDQMRAMRLATLPPAEQAAEYTQQGHEYLTQGLVPEAEQEFQTAIAADAASAEAHAGLAQVRERSGNSADARAEAQSSIMLHPNIPAYLVLARLDLQANDASASARDVSKALQLDPKDSSAQGMRQALQARGQSLP